MKTARRADKVMSPPIVAFKNRLDRWNGREDRIDLTQAVPSYPPPKAVREALAWAAGDSAGHLYTPDPGLPECLEAVAGFLRHRHDARIHSGQLLLTPGANAAFHFVCNILLDPGDPVWLLSPWYFNHPMSLQLLGAEPREIRAQVDLSLSALIDGGHLDVVEPDGLLVVVNPSNPTGRSHGAPEMERLLRWAASRSVRLVIDETYLEFFPGGSEPVSLTRFEDWEKHAVVLGTFSKSLAVTGYRLGYLCAGAEVVEQTLKVQDSAVVCAPRPAQTAVMAGLTWEGLDDWLAERRREIDTRVRAFSSQIESSPGPFTVESAGAFFAYLRTARPMSDALTASAPNGDSQWQIAEHLARTTGVLVLPGHPFGREEGNHLRVAVGNASVDLLREAAQRMQGMPGPGS